VASAARRYSKNSSSYPPSKPSPLEGTVVKVQRVFIGILIVFAGIIFFSSLLNTSLISLAERQREVATLRVQGFDPWQIGGYFFRENLLITVVGTILGMPVGYLLGWAMAVIYNTDTIRFPLVTPPWVFFMTGLLGLLFALLAQLVVQLEISRMDWREALNVKE
jgi:putative ABC transport system permease protein